MSEAAENYLNPKAYFPEGFELSHQENATVRTLEDPENLKNYDRKNICSQHFVNKVYYDRARQGKRDQALETAAETILYNGEKIRDQLLRNDAAQNVEVTEESEHNPPATTDQVKKISGSTIAKVIAKITEILAGKSPEEVQALLSNFAAMFHTLGLPNLQEKFTEAMQNLAQNLVVAADVRDLLEQSENAEALAIFDSVLSDERLDEIKSVTPEEIATRREANSITRQQREERGAGGMTI